MVRAYHEAKGEGDQRDEIITTIFSHPSDYSAASVLGYKVINLYPDSDGMPDLEALKAAVSDRTAALFITNPEDTGIYNARIAEFTKAVHDVGGLCGYDQANANGILGITRAKEAGFDLCFFNLHKTFSSPHGCGGPGSGALGATEAMAGFPPGAPRGIRRLHVLPELRTSRLHRENQELLRGHARRDQGLLLDHGSGSFRTERGGSGGRPEQQLPLQESHARSEERALPYAQGRHRIEQVRYSWEKLFDETGVGTWDITCRLADFGMHMWSSHHPFIVPEPMTLEPTESYSKAELDEYIAVLEQVSKEAYENPELVKTAPHNSVTRRPGHDTLDDPDKWAVTWRSYLKKCSQGKRERI